MIENALIVQGILAVAAVALIALAVTAWGEVAHQIAQRLPNRFRDEYTKRFQVEPRIWDRFAPPAARHLYIRSQIYLVLGIACIAAIAWLHGSFTVALVSGGLSLLVAVLLVWNWTRSELIP